MSHIKLLVLLFLYFVSCECMKITTILPEFGNRILNGKTADDNQFPYQVSLQLNHKHICGGSIISEVKVLTAAHCVITDSGRRLPKEKLRILAGTNYLNNKDPMNYYSVKQYAIHPQYDITSIQYDFAIVFIDGHFNFKLKLMNIKKIALAIEKPRPGAVCYVSGWGDVTASREVVNPNDLQFATITIDPPDVCKMKFVKYFKSPQMLCAGQSNKENTGHGDSGGPLACNNYLTGVVSFGIRGYNQKYPDVYGSVFYSFEWINSTHSSGSINKVSGFALVIIFGVTIKLQLTILNKI